MAEKIKITGKAEIKVTATQLRTKSVDKEKVRGPKQIGQIKRNIAVNFGHITREDLEKRIVAAEKILATGKVPAPPKDTDVDLKARVKELEAEVKKLTPPPTPPADKKPEAKKPAAKKPAAKKK